jgi:ATP-dependent DNA helicase RecQ
MDDLYAALKRYWGYDSFRPMQERIVNSLLNGKDVCVIMPTGGGKSLCYQLPAVVKGGTVVVISPLIALMQDQVAQLGEMGIPAALLNSSIPTDEQRAVMRAAEQGAFRLLYLSPERLARQDTAAWLGRVPLSFFAIDEAHCISEWGHEFRPEYRQLSLLRRSFPDHPIAAFTASATQRVRHDIVAQLEMRDADKYIASFHRANLRYVVRKCEKNEHAPLLAAGVRAYDGESLIVYAPTIREVEWTVDFLEERGIAAVPYHGQMETDARRRNQERWMNDEARVLVGTIAFGLGINKPGVRAVIHTSLPKSIEQYYQEAGRAGRDGEPADCVLLWRPKDIGLLAYFIDQLKDPDEKERAWQRYHAVRRFAESDRCRHRQICEHFGQTPKWERCGACDACGSQPEWVTAPLEEVEAPARRRKKKKTKTAPAAYRETPKPVAAAPRPAAAAPTRKPAAPPPADSELLVFFKEWRRKTAQRSNVPAFVVLPDAALEDLCRKKPTNLRELLNVSGIGERKAELYGRDIFATFEAFHKGARAAERKAPQVSPVVETMQLLSAGKGLEEIADLRDRRLATVVDTVATLVESGRVEYRMEWVGVNTHAAIEAAIKRLGDERVKAIKDSLPEAITYEQIRLVAAYLRRQAELVEPED